MGQNDVVALKVVEASILELTSQTPSGGSCQIGDALFRVRYSSDTWEWEYSGEAFFDALDLAEAIIRDGGVNRQNH